MLLAKILYIRDGKQMCEAALQNRTFCNDGNVMNFLFGSYYMWLLSN